MLIFVDDGKQSNDSVNQACEVFIPREIFAILMTINDALHIVEIFI